MTTCGVHRRQRLVGKQIPVQNNAIYVNGAKWYIFFRVFFFLVHREVRHTFETVGRKELVLTQTVLATGKAYVLKSYVMVKVR